MMLTTLSEYTRSIALLVLLTTLACSILADVKIEQNHQKEFFQGPQQRATTNRANLSETNQNCPINTVPFIRDQSDQVICGECIPGYGGWDDPNRFCKLNEYCDDFGKCVNLKDSPFYYKLCPYETGVPGFCGPGLRCYQHICKPCEDGMIDSIDGKMCVYGEWTYSKWKALLHYPGDLALLMIFLNLLGLTFYFSTST